MEVSSKLQLKPGQSVAVLNPPPGLVLPDVVTAATAADASRRRGAFNCTLPYRSTTLG